MEKFAKRRKAFARFGLLVFVSFLFSQKIVAQNSRRAKIVADEIFSFEASEEFIFVNQRWSEVFEDSYGRGLAVTCVQRANMLKNICSSPACMNRYVNSW